MNIEAKKLKISMFWVTSPCSPLKGNGGSEYITSILGVEKQAEQETSVK
jgi:hypothetical protein